MNIPAPRLLSTRLAVAAALGVAVTVAAFAATGYVLIRDGAYDEIDRSLRVTADEAAIAASRTDLGERDFASPPTSRAGGVTPRTDPSPAPATTFVQRLEDGRPLGPARIAGTATTTPDPLPALPPGPPRTVDIRGEPFRVVVRDLPPSPDGRPRTVEVARSVRDVEATLDQAATRLTLGAVAASALALLIALVATRRGLRRLVRVRDAAERVAASEDLTVRIPDDRPDEVGGLATAMNRMLTRLAAAHDRLAGALDEQRRFAADASHELRTPLTALRGDIELLRRHDLPAGERAQVLEEMGAAAARMERMVEDLLVLARSEGAQADHCADVDLGGIVRELVRPGEDARLPAGPAAPVVRAD
ncbi:MAG: HAMP domain-containing sensor histidine kinase, partial [Actinomycetota bacterium]